MKTLKLIWAYTVGHPLTYDLAAVAIGQTAANLGWFKPWVTGLCYGWLLAKVVSLRIRYNRLKK